MTPQTIFLHQQHLILNCVIASITILKSINRIIDISTFCSKSLKMLFYNLQVFVITL